MPRKKPVEQPRREVPPEETWEVGWYRMRRWLPGPGGRPARPNLFIVALPTSHAVIGIEIKSTATAAELADLVERTMVEPRAGTPHRPTRVVCAHEAASGALAVRLAPLGIAVERAPTPELGLLVGVMEVQMGGLPRPGFADAPDATPERVGQILAAAADYHRRAPWRRIGADMPIEVRYPAADGAPSFAVVMGEGGQTFGVALHRKVSDLILAFALDPEANASKPTEREGIVYGDVTECAFADLDGIDEHGWEVAGPDAYPTPLLVDRRGRLRAPTAVDLDLFEAALRAIPEFAEKHLAGLGEDVSVVEATLSVPVAGAEAEVFLRFPPDLVAAKRRGRRSTPRRKEDEEAKG